MTAERSREMLHKKPFKRFNLKFADGTKIPVTHPEWVFIFPSGRTVTIAQPDDSAETVDFLLVTSLEIPREKPRRSKLY